MRWADVWRFIRSWEGIVPSVVAVAAVIYYGPQKMLQTWDWYVDRFRDRAVYSILKNRLMNVPPRLYGAFGMQGNAGQIEFPWYAVEIAQALKRSEKSVFRSLLRLEDKGKVERYQGGWRLKG
jgi:hypothetical protein